MSFSQRTHGCGELRLEHAGSRVVLNGWAHRIRDLGGLYFVDVRDRTGIVQVLLDPAEFESLAEIKSETVLAIRGAVRPRSEGTRNPRMATGDVEVVADAYEILGPAKVLPFPVSDEELMSQVNEELRIKYRYVDLRRPSMYRKLAVRAEIVKQIRAYLDERGFLEIETPIITKSTPEGARDYLVPYRLEPGRFYALPQSPQQYKQLLMVGGVERYYQIAKCFRDEAQRADRQPEFTQLDLEMSFVTQEDVLQLAEGLTIEVCNAVVSKFGLEKDPVAPFPRLTYRESMDRYGCDKPDLRFGLELFDVSDVAATCGFGVFKSTIEGGGVVRGVRYPGGASLSRKEVSELEEFAKGFGAKGMATMAVSDGEGAIETPTGWKMRGGVAKFFTPEELEVIRDRADAEDGDLLCFVADQRAAGDNVLFRLRNEIGRRAGLADPRKLAFCWVLDFPLVEWVEEASGVGHQATGSEEAAGVARQAAGPEARSPKPDATPSNPQSKGHWSSTHHPFTGPKAEHLDRLETDPGSVLADCYDIVCNGTEWASGSIRIHRPDVQARVFKLLGIDEQAQAERFGHILEAFQLGAPPHGGIAPGIDRLAMMLLDEENIREVIAFPKIGQGVDPMMGAPSEIDSEQWDEMGLQLRMGKK